MEFTNEVLKKMESKLKFNDKFAGYFYRLYLETKEQRYFNLSNNVKNCLNCWVWDEYRSNKLLDLIKVNRCKCRFCSNCRKFDLSRALNNLSPYFKRLILDGYYPYLLTLTVPNCFGSDLDDVLNKMQVSFKKFYNWFSCDNKKGYSDRFMKFSGCVRCIEITYNKKTNMYHPHYHCVVFSDYYNPLIFDKKYEGEWSNNRQSFNFYSDFDFQIRKLWTIAFNNLTLRDFNNLVDCYICDVREMDDKGIFEVLKYSFKDTDIDNYYVFKDIYFSVYGRRLKQGYGLLHNVKLEGESDGNLQGLESYLKIEESPVELLTQNIETLYTRYSNYIKISRFNKHSNLNSIE